jgi:hypothetical protein
LKIIAEHHLGGNPDTLEEKIVWDADKIDLIDIIGIMRVFHWFGEMQRHFADAISYCQKLKESIYSQFKTATARS